MLGLILDTSHETTHILITKDSECLYSSSLPPTYKQSESLLPEIKNVLNSQGVALSSLSFIGVGIGPGTFLGTRLGVITAKSLSYATSIPLVSFCSLLPYIDQTQHFSSFLIVSDAKSKGFYTLKGSSFPEISIANSPSLMTLEEIKAFNPDCLFTPPTPAPLLTSHREALPEIKPCPFQKDLIASYCFKQFIEGFTQSSIELKIPYLIALQ